jgi:hypothetical protein
MIGFLLGVFYVEHRAQKLMDRNGIGDRYRVETIGRNSDTSHIFKRRSVEELLKLVEEGKKK